jgi:hypothetical protein
MILNAQLRVERLDLGHRVHYQIRCRAHDGADRQIPITAL